MDSSHANVDVAPTSLPERRRRVGGTRGLALFAWTGGVGSIALLAIEYRLRILHPASLLFLLLLAMTVMPALAAVAFALFRRSKDQARQDRWRWTVAALIPAIVWTAWGTYAYHAFSTREIPRNLPMRLIEVAGASAHEARAVYLFPHRIETPRLVMFYDDAVTDPRRDADEMDRHVARMESLTGLRLREKIFLVRGPIFAGRHVCFQGLAFGSAGGGIDYVDRHELAHAIMSQQGQLDTDPPTLLGEGWAESQSVAPEELAKGALAAKKFVTGFYVA